MTQPATVTPPSTPAEAFYAELITELRRVGVSLNDALAAWPEVRRRMSAIAAMRHDWINQ